MISPAWRHRERVENAQAVEKIKAAAERQETDTVKRMASDKAKFELMLTALDNECKRISALPQGSVRNELKRELLKIWLPLIEAYLASGEVFANPVLTQVMIWCFDAGEIDDALRLADAAIEQNQAMPERFNRNIRTYVADAFLDWCREQQATKGAIQPYLSTMFVQVIDWPVHDEIKAKYCKMAAADRRAEGNLELALELYEQAEKLSPTKAQVKTVKAELTKEIAAKQEAERHAQAKGKTEQ